MKIKRFKTFVESADADDYKGMDVDKGMPKKEKEMVDDATAKKDAKKKHPVAGDHQFNGDRKEVKS